MAGQGSSGADGEAGAAAAGKLGKAAAKMPSHLQPKVRTKVGCRGQDVWLLSGAAEICRLRSASGDQVIVGVNSSRHS